MTSKPLNVFISYAHEDEPFKDRLIKHLAILQHEQLISAWQDRMIVAGEDWQRRIDSQLDSADVILLLISSDFLASNYCWGVEMARALQRHETGSVCVIPIILRSVEWAHAPIAKLQALPRGARAVNTWEREDDAFADITRSIRLAVEDLMRRQPTPDRPPGAAPPSAGEAVAASRPATARPTAPAAPIRLGILLSRTGDLAMTEAPMITAGLLAVQEINERGGLLGRRVEAIVSDAESDEREFERRAEELITTKDAVTIVGCCTSSSRKAVKPIVERHNHLLVYPMQHEGLERSPNIVYVGSAPNQQFLWAAQYLYAMRRVRRVFLVGSDYIYPRAAAAMIRDAIEFLGGEIVGDEYIPIGSYDVSQVITAIEQSRPEIIMSSVVGGTNLALYKAMRKHGIRPDEVPTLATNMTVGEIRYVGPELLAGNYSAWSYFMEIPGDANQAFLERFHATVGTDEIVSDPMEATYAAVHLWGQAVSAAGSDDVAAIREHMLTQSLVAPEGMIQMDPQTGYARRIARLACIQPDGHFKVINRSEDPVVPEPYPPTRTVDEWEAFLQGLYDGWGGRWESTSQ